MESINYRLTIEYDGTPFSGFQAQNRRGVLTIQEELERILSGIFDHPIQVYVAGRTDAGVHAVGQVIHFHAHRAMPASRLHRALDGLLHRAVSVRAVEEAHPDFHARFDAIGRHYVYVLDNSPHPCALLRDRCFWHPLPLNMDRMKDAAAAFVGRRDFRVFSVGMKGAENTVRTLKYSSVFLGLDCDMPGRAEEILLPFRGRERVISFYFEGDGFLRGQVRIMTGYLVGVGRGRLDAEDIRMMLETGKCHARGAAKLTGRGLYLAGVDYPPPRSVF